ncbi:MAG TPA: anthranilate synthase component I [Thermoanaerobaculia bacterium]|nr:anthranilate synthase component I [Thermoanaerobaculia bacterium]
MRSLPAIATAGELDRLRNDYDVVPVVRELSADTITAVGAFRAISGLSPEAFLLESVERGESLGRHSFIGFSPRRALSFERGERGVVERLRQELVPLRVFGEDRLPPFFGGAVGWFGYGAATWTERIPDTRPDTLALPDAKLLFFDNVLVFDHLRQRLFLVASLRSWDQRSSEELLSGAEQDLEQVVAALSRSVPDFIPLDDATSGHYQPNQTREEFERSVFRAREEIAAGEIFQIVVSQQWTTAFPTDQALTLYRSLRSVNPSPYMFLLRTKECTLVGSSPEMLVRLEHRRAETRPIAGTRPRGGSRNEDQIFAAELLADPKENAEHLMLVDLGRNDLGRVCESGSVRVTRFREVERYSHVMHLVSDVEGRLREDQTPIDLFLSAFPAGTVSGAPKVRAMELIDELEPSRRGPYAGAIAYFGFSGNLDSCIAIRTIVLKDDRAYVQAGAGIVHDSVPAREYEETVNKSMALRRAIDLAKASLQAREAESRSGEEPRGESLTGPRGETDQTRHAASTVAPGKEIAR